jgi:hypothetical protein
MAEFGAGELRELDAFFGSYDNISESIIPPEIKKGNADDFEIKKGNADDDFEIEEGSDDEIEIEGNIDSLDDEIEIDGGNDSSDDTIIIDGGSDVCKCGGATTKFEQMVKCLRDGGFDAEDVLNLLMYGSVLGEKHTSINNITSDIINGAGEREVFQEAINVAQSECYGECAPACKTIECAKEAGYTKDEIAAKPDGPADTTALLSNFDIDAVLTEWKKKFPKFHPCSFSMIDFEQKGDELSTVNIADLLAEGAETFGVVINTDTYQGTGKHWMALFIDLRDISTISNDGNSGNSGGNISIEFFNSTGDKEGRIARGEKFPQIKAWIEKMAAQVRAAGLTPRRQLVLYTHQKLQTECGVYSLYYIWNRLNGTTPAEISNNRIPDEDMHKFRKFLFRSD